MHVHNNRFSRISIMLWFAAFFFVANSNAIAQKSSLLWEISKEGNNEVSYLFGTMHTGDSLMFQKRNSLFQFIEQCDVFSGELDLNETPDPVAMSMRMMSEVPLSELYSEEEYEQINDYLTEKLGEMAPIISMFKPFWIMATVIQVEETNLNPSAEDSTRQARAASEVIDVQLQRFAEAERKEIRPLETMEEQMSAIESIDIKEQAQMLLDLATNTDKNTKMMKDLKESYRSGDIDEMFELYQSEGYGTDVERLLVDIRNEHMAERLAQLIEEGKPVFCAIGALHLPGAEGVIERLIAMGYQLKPEEY